MKKEILKTKNNNGFVILFAVTLAAIFLSIALGVGEVALKEVQFSTNARDTDNAFYAADTAIENVLFQDKGGVLCVPPSYPPGGQNACTYTFSQLGSSGTSCAVVTMTKDSLIQEPSTTTKVVSNGYNNGGASSGSCNPSANSVNRELDINY